MKLPSRVESSGSPPVVWPADSMADALAAECDTLGELLAVIRRQRNAVARDDLPTIDDTVFATHRILVTLNEARHRRRALNQLLGLREEVGVGALEEELGSRMTPELREARDSLIDMARTLSREVAINRDVLRGALSNGEALLRGLTGAGVGVTSVSYTPAQGTTTVSGSPMLDRRI
jgi:hypothetical protein